LERAADGLRLTGALTIHGITRQVEIPVTQIHGSERDAWGNRRIGFVAQTSVSRRAYDIKGTAFWNSEFDPGRFSVGDEVTIELTVEARVSNVERWNNPVADSLLAAGTRDGWNRALAAFGDRFRDSAAPAARSGAEALTTAAAKLIQRGDLDAAARVYDVLVEVRPGSAAAQAGLGEVFLMRGQREAAVAAFRRALVADSTNSTAAEYLRHLLPEP
jgi:tetratricopeptide (TPR) repeat protein